MANPDPQEVAVFNAVAYSTTGDNTSSIILVPHWAKQMTIFIKATHTGTLDTIFSGRSLPAETFQTDSARATAVAGSQYTFDFPAPKVQFVWASGTASAGTVNAFVYFTR